MKTRFSDKYKTIYSFNDHFLVVCPQCSNCADVIASQPSSHSYRPTAKLTCLCCGYSSEAALDSYSPGKPKDWYFHHPLWLQAQCAGHTFWAYNLEQLEYIGEYIQVDLREKLKDGSGWHSNSLLNRLPRWIKESGNREAVMKAIDKLRKTVAGERSVIRQGDILL